MQMDAVRSSRRFALIAAVVSIPLGVWGVRVVAHQDKLAGVATASAAAAAHGCELGAVAITRMVSATREHSTIGWAESGSTVAKDFAGGCRPQATAAHGS